MKLYIVTDMEGCSAVVRENQLHGMTAPSAEGRRILSVETNAAVDAAYKAGAKEVYVQHGHVSAEEIRWEEWDSRPNYVLGAGILETLDSSFDALGFIGQHAKYASGGVLEHTFGMTNYHEVTLNGVSVGEIGFIVAVAGDSGVPVVFLSGDDAACEEVSALAEGVVAVSVKRPLTRGSAVTLHPDAAAEKIREAVTEGLAKAGNIRPWKLEGPVEMVIEYTSCAPAERNTLVPGVERFGPRAIRYEGETATDVYRMFGLLGRIV